MIVRPKLHWFRMLFVWRGSVLHRILPQLIGLLVLSIGVSLLNNTYPMFLPTLTPIPFTLLGIALAIFLGFRNSVCYDRFWEARKLWGNLLNDTRSIARQIDSITNASLEQKNVFTYTLIAFIQALKAQLREQPYTDSNPALLREKNRTRILKAQFKPALILQDLGQQLQLLIQEQRVDTISSSRIDYHLSNLTESLGGCERIASTPIPFTYSVILHRTVYLYCLLLPFGLIGNLGWGTPIITVFIAYTFLALEALADELQDPFGTEPNDLALDAMSNMIEITLREMLDEDALPTATTPINFILS